jgi:hypothetical protein
LIRFDLIVIESNRLILVLDHTTVLTRAFFRIVLVWELGERGDGMEWGGREEL